MELTAHDSFTLGGYYERLRALEYDARNILIKYGYGHITDLKVAIVTCMEDASYTVAAEKKPREPKGKAKAKSSREAAADAQAEVENGRAEAAEFQQDQPDDPYPKVSEASP